MRTNDNGLDCDMTQEELTAYNLQLSIYLAEQAAQAKAQAEAEAAKAVAQAKLAALGLDADDLKALGL